MCNLKRVRQGEGNTLIRRPDDFSSLPSVGGTGLYSASTMSLPLSRAFFSYYRIYKRQHHFLYVHQLSHCRNSYRKYAASHAPHSAQASERMTDICRGAAPTNKPSALHELPSPPQTPHSSRASALSHVPSQPLWFPLPPQTCRVVAAY